MGDGRFLPDENITLAEAATILLRTLGYTGKQAGAVWPQGYIDLGRAGIGDKWCDIALCWRSLHHSYADWCRQTDGAPPDGKLLFRALGLEPDWTRIRYYILLDELF